MKGKYLLLSVLLPLVLSACETEFLDDFEDGVVNPAYHFIVGAGNSSVFYIFKAQIQEEPELDANSIMLRE